MRTHVFTIQGQTTGDTQVKFSPEDSASVAMAMEKFAELTGQGMVAFDKNKSPPDQRVRSFDPNVEETIFARNMQGG